MRRGSSPATRETHTPTCTPNARPTAPPAGQNWGGVQEPDAQDDAETTLLFSASALFADAKLDREAYDRVTAYLQRRFGVSAVA
jgi:hypothetical protein